MDRILSESPWMTVINKANDEVEINIEGVIGGDFWDEDDEEKLNTKEKLRNELKTIGGLKAKKIIVNINSYGGDVNHGISMYELLVQNQAKVITRVNGFTASIATVIAMAGEEREMSSNSLFLIHKPMLMMIGHFNENDLTQANEDVVKVGTRIKNIYEKAGVKPSIIDELMEENSGQGKWLDADEAEEKGFINSVYEPLKMAAVYDPKILNKLNISTLPKIDNMETSKLNEMFEDLKGFISGIINPKKDDPETGDSISEIPPAEKEETIMVAPAEISARLISMQEAIDAIKRDEAIVAENETLKAEKAEYDKKLSDLRAENETQKQKLIKLEGKITQGNSQSTKLEGIEGMEDPDRTQTAEQRQLTRDLQSLRAQLNEVHN